MKVSSFQKWIYATSRRLNRLIEAFDEYILALASNILPLIRAGHPEVVVTLIKIAEVEGREDEKVCRHMSLTV